MWLEEPFHIRPSLEWMSFGNKIPFLISWKQLAANEKRFAKTFLVNHWFTQMMCERLGSQRAASQKCARTWTIISKSRQRVLRWWIFQPFIAFAIALLQVQLFKTAPRTLIPELCWRLQTVHDKMQRKQLVSPESPSCKNNFRRT